MHQNPPDWKEIIKKPKTLEKLFNSKELWEVLQRAHEKYVSWNIFKYYKFPNDISAEEAWAYLKISLRLQKEGTPIRGNDGSAFGFNIVNSIQRRLSYIDTNGAGLIKTLTEVPSAAQREQLIMSGLSEEAIASSQIEGANTSRKVAKEMIYSGRKPRTTDEQMIINSYKVMQHIESLKDVDLSESMLLEIQTMITKDTLESPDESGRFRNDNDEIVVSDRLTGEVVYEPPKQEKMEIELQRLIKYANELDDENRTFVHPVIKATILHFWLAYIHPFADGNGRTARAVFHWYLLKRGYWLFQYLSVSRVIKSSKKRYDRAYLDTEEDEGDLTYFLLYITEAICRAIEDLMQHYEKKAEEAERYRKVADRHSDLNERQVSLLDYFNRHNDEVIDIKTHQSKHGIVYETARKDLTVLSSKGLITQMKKKKRIIFLPNMLEIKKLLMQ